MGHSFQNSSYFALQYNLHHAVINYGSAVLVRIDQCLRTGTVNEAWNTRGKLKDPLERILRENGIRMPRVGQLFFNVCLGLSEVIRHHEALDVNAVPDGPVVSGHLLSHSNSFGFEMEKDAVGCRAFNRNCYCRSALRLSRTVLTAYSTLCVEYSFVVRNIACNNALAAHFALYAKSGFTVRNRHRDNRHCCFTA